MCSRSSKVAGSINRENTLFPLPFPRGQRSLTRHASSQPLPSPRPPTLVTISHVLFSRFDCMANSGSISMGEACSCTIRFCKVTNLALRMRLYDTCGSICVYSPVGNFHTPVPRRGPSTEDGTKRGGFRKNSRSSLCTLLGICST